MQAGEMQYTSAMGLPALQILISTHYSQGYDLDIAPVRIVVTAGASATLLLACAALVEKGAEILMPDPSYPCNRHFVAVFEGSAKMIPSGTAERFQLAVRAHWGEATRGVYWLRHQIRMVPQSLSQN